MHANSHCSLTPTALKWLIVSVIHKWLLWFQSVDEFRDAELIAAGDSEDNTQTKSDTEPSVIGKNYWHR